MSEKSTSALKFPRQAGRLKTHTQFSKDLAQLYALALENHNFAVALRALELRGKELGLFDDKNFALPSLKEMTKEQLKALLGNEKGFHSEKP